MKQKNKIIKVDILDLFVGKTRKEILLLCEQYNSIPLVEFNRYHVCPKSGEHCCFDTSHGILAVNKDLLKKLKDKLGEENETKV